MKLPGAVRKLRRTLGLSQGKLAAKLGVTAQAVASWEQGIYRPDPMNCLKMAGLCGGELCDTFAARAGAPDLLAYVGRRALARQKKLRRGLERAQNKPPTLEDRIAHVEALLARMAEALERLEQKIAGPPGAQPRVTVKEPISVSRGTHARQKRQEEATGAS